MRAYEVMYIIRPDVDEAQFEAVIEKFNTIIANNSGEVVTTDKWGKRKLAYEINDYRDGYYVLVNFNGNAETAAELDRVFKITDEVMRHLIVRKEDK